MFGYNGVRARTLRRAKLMKRIKENHRELVLKRTDRTKPVKPSVRIKFQQAWAVNRRYF